MFSRRGLPPPRRATSHNALAQETLAQFASTLIESQLADLDRIHDSDHRASSISAPGDHAPIEVLRVVWQLFAQWTAEADQVLARVDDLEAPATPWRVPANFAMPSRASEPGFASPPKKSSALASRSPPARLCPQGSCAMSFKLNFALDAQADWRQLEFDLQEALLDELERLADDPDLRSKINEDQYEFEIVIDQLLHCFYLTILLNAANQSLSILSVGHFSIPA